MRIIALTVLLGVLIVAVPVRAERIVSLAPNITEIIYAAGAGDQLVGVVEYSDFPQAALALPVVGDAYRLDFEKIRQLEPDVIIGWKSGNPRELLQRLRDLDYTVLELEVEELEDVALQIEQIGRLAGTADRAYAAAFDYRAQIDTLRTNFSDQPVLKVFYQISAQPYYSITGKHVISELIEACGGENIFADLPGLAPPVSLESIIAANPDVIVAATPAESNEWQAGWQRWGAVNAVRNKALYGVNPDLVSRSGPRLAEGAEHLCRMLAETRDKLED